LFQTSFSQTGITNSHLDTFSYTDILTAIVNRYLHIATIAITVTA